MKHSSYYGLMMVLLMTLSLGACKKQSLPAETETPPTVTENTVDTEGKGETETALPPIEMNTDGMSERDAIMNDESSTVETTEQVTYVEYSEEVYKEKLGKEPMVLFFHASWCPTCKVIDELIRQDSLAGNATILKVNYDTELMLRKEYGVTMQSTLVGLNKEGKVVETKISATNLKDLQELLTLVK